MAQKTPQEFFRELPLYQRIGWERAGVFSITKLLYFRGNIDCYCLGCRRESTFHSQGGVMPPELTEERYRKELQLHAAVGAPMRSGSTSDKPKPPLLPPNIYEVNFSCGRVPAHKLRFIYLVQNEAKVTDESLEQVSQWLQKIGQFPSVADLHLPQIQKYRSILGSDAYADFAKGIGLAAHGVGVGAYVYLRRVFEGLVRDAHAAAIQSPTWDNSGYAEMRMQEKVAALREYLPAFLIDHPEMYGLLSKGLHELTENECLSHFPALKVGIELILDQKMEEEARKRKLTEASKAIKAAASHASNRAS